MKYFPIGRHVSLIYRAQQSFFKQKTKSFDIGGGQLSFIFALYLNPGSCQDDIAKHLELDKTTVTRAASKLEKCGVIKRERDQDDHRIIRLYLTNKGKTLHDELKDVAHDWQDTLVNGMSESDLIELERLITIMSKNSRRFKLEIYSEKDDKVKNEAE